MLKSRTALGHAAIVAATVVLAGVSATYIPAQEAEETVVRNHLKVTEADSKAAADVKFSSAHVMAANIAGAKEKVAALNAANDKRVAEDLGKLPEPEIAHPNSTLTSPFFYPADLVNSGGGTVTKAVNHALYVDYSGTIAANWGNPEGFLKDLFKDQMIQLTNQYTGSTTAGPYTVGANASVKYGFYGNVLYEHEIWAIVHAAAKKMGAGPNHIYHVFLPKGLDTCFDESASCYSPDNLNTWSFCAYHNAVDFGTKDIGLVLFTVEPYQDVDGCAVAKPWPNSKLADSTNSVLSHETFETITDPIPPNGWTNLTSLDEWGFEIGDECQPLVNSSNDFLVPTFKINGKKYEIQLEYSNTYHACAAQP